jgi:glycosyltransferase involved in cell wall biosynthesis
MNNPKISIITVVFNGVDVIESTILSVINQSYKNIEYIVIDGKSNDGTVEILDRYKSKISYYISEPDKGIYDAMNKGVAVATGDWVFFLGAGDILLNSLHQITALFKNTKIIYYGNVYRNDLNQIYDGRFSGFKLAIVNICHQCIFYPVAILKKYKYNTKYRIQADHHLNMLCYGDKDYSFEYIPNLVSIYEGDGFSATNVDVDFFKDKLDIIKNNFNFLVYTYALLRRTFRKVIG